MGRGKGQGKGSGDGGGRMLQAQRSALEATLMEHLVQLQATEMAYYTGNFSTIGTVSSLLAGFAFTGGITASTVYSGWLAPWLSEENSETKMIVVTAFYICAAFAFCFFMLTSLVCTALNVRGPGFALRGPDGSLKYVVNVLAKWQKRVCVIVARRLFSFTHAFFSRP